MTAPASRPDCYRHPGTPSSALCAHCDRPICTDCMGQAPVGWQCPECIKSGAKSSPVQRVTFSRNRTGVVGSTNPTPVVITLVAVNVACFVASGFGRSSVIDRFGGLSHKVQQSDEYYRLVTSLFLHFDFLHIASNMLSLLIVGPAVEVMLGRTRFVTLYLLAGIGGAVLYYLIAPAASVGAGASGAIFGVMSAYVVLAYRQRKPMAPIVALIAINLVLGFAVPGIGWQAHIGGLIVGAVVALAYDYALGLRQQAQRLALLVGSSGATLIVFAILVKAVPPGHIFLEFT
jgi:membrane associated rhomboid family serine protease